MEPHFEIHENEKRELSHGDLNEVGNCNVSGRIEVFNELAEGSGFSDTLQSKSGHYGNLPPSRTSDLMNLGNLESASTNSLFSTVNRILDESIEKNNYESIPLRVGSVLKLVVQEIERRVSKQADDVRKQSVMCKSREDRFHLRIRALESLATGNTAETEVVQNQLQHVKIEKMNLEEKRRLDEQVILKLNAEKETCNSAISSMNEELTFAKKSYEEKLFQLEAKAEETKDNLQKKIVELECLLSQLSEKVKELEDSAKLNLLQWESKQTRLKYSINSWFGSLQKIRSESEKLKKEFLKIRNSHAEDFYNFGLHLRGLTDRAQTYHDVLEENIKLYNEVQDLKGSIRVYCRVRPFLLGQSKKHTTIHHIGENGELGVINPSKPGKDGHQLFKFNKVFGPAATQEDIYYDIQPLVRSVLDGFNICIFAYGQTGSGKTYTMSGPNVASSVNWGVNYRALNDLFSISQKRSVSFAYEVCVQMIEIYNEQVRDLLCSDNLQKRLGISSTSLPNGLAVPDASLHPVKSTMDVIQLMSAGLINRAVGATSLNERSSRSHSILTVLVQGTDSETNRTLHGCLHLVDLAGSEKIDRSRATGDILREAQHVNMSLSALGDVIFALAQKCPNIPYKNSKLTQVLESSLGGQAKIVMCIQLNPDVASYSETISTLKFAERVSSIELGTARSHREDRGVSEQIASLKKIVAKKDEELGRLSLLRTRSSMSSTRYGSSPRRHSLGGLRPSPKHSVAKSSYSKATSEYSSEQSDKHSEAGSQQSVDDFHQSRLTYPDDDVILEGLLGDEDSEERLSDISDGDLSMGTETDGSISSIIEYTLFPETANPSDDITEKCASQNSFHDSISLNKCTSMVSRPDQQVQSMVRQSKLTETGSSSFSLSRSSSKIPSSKRGVVSTSSPTKTTKRWQ